MNLYHIRCDKEECEYEQLYEAVYAAKEQDFKSLAEKFLDCDKECQWFHTFREFAPWYEKGAYRLMKIGTALDGIEEGIISANINWG